jgi:CBS domain-containing protein
MTDFNEEFRQTFEAIKRVINRFAALEDSNEFELSAACAKSYLIRNRRVELEYIRQVRNVQNHPQQGSGQPTFVITEAFVGVCRDLLAQISKAARAGELGVKMQDLCVATWDDLIHPLIATMREKKYSHIPILDKSGIVVGVFNESSILDYLIRSGMASLIEPDATLAEIRIHCLLGADHTETFRFIGPLAPEDEVADIFVTVSGQFTRVGAVFVTPGAAADKPIQRMITAWDVLAHKQGS